MGIKCRIFNWFLPSKLVDWWFKNPTKRFRRIKHNRLWNYVNKNINWLLSFNDSKINRNFILSFFVFFDYQSLNCKIKEENFGRKYKFPDFNKQWRIEGGGNWANAQSDFFYTYFILLYLSFKVPFSFILIFFIFIFFWINAV